jgi:hypothetical protein
MANCGPWVAVMAGIIQMWDCYRQAREGAATWAGLQGGIRDIMAVRGLADLKGEPMDGKTNIGYILGYREHMRKHIPMRKCPKRYDEREVLVVERAQPGKSGLLKQTAYTQRSGKRNTCETGEAHEEATSGEEVQITGTVERRDEPWRADKLNQWGLAESVKRGDGNCYVYSIGEALGLFCGLKN